MPVSSQKYYIIFAEVSDNELTAKNDDLIGATVDYSEGNEQRVWRGVGKYILQYNNCIACWD